MLCVEAFVMCVTMRTVLHVCAAFGHWRADNSLLLVIIWVKLCVLQLLPCV